MAIRRGMLAVAMVAAVTVIGHPASGALAARSPGDGLRAAAQVDPTAGRWRTWVLSAGSQLRPVPPPDDASTADELHQLHALAAQRDAAALDRIAFWDAGAPGYRWDGVLADELAKHNLAGGTR